METIKWGIIGCGDVTEVKSGPAFSKVPDSALVAVMRRNGEKAREYAQRHGVPRWYQDADALINDTGINAIYIATPPDSHEAYTMAAIKAGKPVYVEKPMALNYAAARKMADYAMEKNVKLSVAHYRRAQPFYLKIAELLKKKAIGKVRAIQLTYFKEAAVNEGVPSTTGAWRLNPAISGGGLFHDLAPHQLDIMVYLFGPAIKATGMSAGGFNSGAITDLVSGSMLFEEEIIFNGLWYFNAAAGEQCDQCIITGSEGSIRFRIFETAPLIVTSLAGITSYEFDPLPHVQQPMIEKVVAYFLGRGANPCSGAEGAAIMQLMEAFTGK